MPENEEKTDAVPEVDAQEANPEAYAENEYEGESAETAPESVIEGASAESVSEGEAAPYADAYEGQQDTSAKKSGFIPKPAIIIAIVCLCAAVAAAAVLYISEREKNYNPYNEMGYYNTGGRTLDEVASEFTMSLEEFLEEFELPTDMRGDTYEVAAYNMMPVSRVAEMYGLDFDTMKQYFAFDDTVTEDTPYGEAYDTIKLKDIYGESLDNVKEEYGLDDSVTGETTWGEVRSIIEKKDYEDWLKSEAEAESAAAEQESESVEA